MSRLLFIIKKELLCIRENKIFNLATIASPLFFWLHLLLCYPMAYHFRLIYHPRMKRQLFFSRQKILLPLTESTTWN